MREEGVFEEMRQWGHPHVLSEKKKNMGKTLRTKARDNAAAAAQRLVLRASGVLKLKIAKRHLCNALHSS